MFVECMKNCLQHSHSCQHHDLIHNSIKKDVATTCDEGLESDKIVINMNNKEKVHLNILKSELGNIDETFIYANAHIAELEIDIQRKNIEIVNLLQEIEYEKNACAIATRKLEKTKNRRSNNVTDCMCCLNEFDTDCMVECDSGHTICSLCIEKTCKTINIDMDTVNFVFACPGRECNGHIDINNLCKFKSGLELVLQWQHVESMKKSLNMLHSCHDLTTKRLYFSNKDGTYRGYQCSKCLFGPIIYYGCNNLLTHHNKSGSYKCKNNNSCPNCGHVHKSVEEMRQWNGNNLVT
jgi:hypothetical protein